MPSDPNSTPRRTRGRAQVPPHGSSPASPPVPSQGGVYGAASADGARRSGRGTVVSTKASTTASKKNKHRGPLWAKFSIGLGALVMIASIGAYAVFQAGIHELNTAVKTVHVLSSDPATVPKLNGSTIKGPISILMVGVDATGHTDSIIIAHIPASHTSVYLISIPRDTRVLTPTGGHDKINAMYGAGNMARLQATIKLNWNITVNAALIINFNGFGNIVTKLGGVTMYVDETTYSIHHGYLNNNPNDHAPGYPYHINPNTGVPECYNKHYTWGGTHNNPSLCTLPGISEVIYPKGNYTFDAYSALDFVRCRDGLVGTDYGRQRHQQQFIKAVLDKVYSKGLSDPTKLLGLINSMSSAFQFDNNGVPMVDWLFTLDKISPNDLVTIKTNDGQVDTSTDTSSSMQDLTPDSIQLFNAIRDDNGTGDPVGAFLVTHPDWVAST